jgi:outer membrane protein assembly factor BamB
MLRFLLACVIVLVIFGWSAVDADDWPTWLGSASRGGFSEEQLQADLKLAWAWRADHAPSPILKFESLLGRRGQLGGTPTPASLSDHAFQVVAADGKVYFGSSVEESVTCLSAADGEVLWTFYTEGAIRFAPVCHEGRVYFGSDDGYVYCVGGTDGKLVWKFQAALGKRRIIANGRISSQWPVRTGLTIRDGIVYAACGIFPSEDRGVMLYGLDAATGKPAWRQRLLIHAMGHLLAEEKSLVVPAGRAAPLDVNRSDGERQGYKFVTRRDEGGGSPVVIAGMLVYGPNEPGFLKVLPTRKMPEYTGTLKQYAGSRAPGLQTGLQGSRMVADGERIVILRKDGIHSLARKPFMAALLDSTKAFGTKAERAEREKAFKERGFGRVFLKSHQQGRDDPILMADMKACTKWRVENTAGLVSMIRAGDQIITGGKGIVQARGAADGKPLWSANVEGVVWDLAASDGAVFASTDAGHVYCLRSGGQWRAFKAMERAALFGDAKQKPYKDFVNAALARADTQKGYCVVAGLTDGRMIAEVLRQSEFFVLGIDSDPAVVERVRGTLSRAGEYGARVTVHQVDYKALPYLDYFANVVLSESAFATGKLPCAPGVLSPMAQPGGGLLMLAADAQALNAAAEQMPGWKVEPYGDRAWGSLVRPQLEGAGEWTHMFANPANTLSSGDKLIDGTKYDIQWIGQPGGERQIGGHSLSMTDLYKDGRLYLTRADHMMALDAYNGTVLWGTDVPGSLRLGVGHESGLACVDSDYMYVAATNDCWLLDVETGEKARAYTVPDKESDWGYVAIVGEQLLGSSQNPDATVNMQKGTMRAGSSKGEGEHVRSAWGVMNNTQVVSTELFSLAKADGARQWQYKTGSHILNTTVAISDGTVYFAENRHADLPGAAKGIVFLRDFLPQDAFLVALDLKTGRKRWEKSFSSKGEEIFYLSCTPDALLTVTSANTPFEGDEKDKPKNYYQLRLFDARDGAERWRRSVIAGKESYAHNVNIQPAVIMGGKAYLSMRTGGRLFTFDMATGEHTETPGYRGSKGCGVTTASATSLFFRNMASQGYDTVSKQTFWTSSISRPSCWLNDIPAGGLILMPEASTGCTCAFAIKVSIVLAPQR